MDPAGSVRRQGDVGMEEEEHVPGGDLPPAFICPARPLGADTTRTPSVERASSTVRSALPPSITITSRSPGILARACSCRAMRASSSSTGR